MTFIQSIEANHEYLEFNFDPAICFAAIFFIFIGLLFLFLADRISLKALGTVLFLVGILGGLVQLEKKLETQTNYLVVCDETVTVREIMEEYRIIEQVGNGLVITKISPEEE